jgi:hypothetical protein
MKCSYKNRKFHAIKILAGYGSAAFGLSSGVIAKSCLIVLLWSVLSMCVLIHLLDASSLFFFSLGISTLLVLKILKFFIFYVYYKISKTLLFLLKHYHLSLQGILHSSNFVVRLMYHLLLLCVFRCPYDVVILHVLFFLASKAVIGPVKIQWLIQRHNTNFK